MFIKDPSGPGPPGITHFVPVSREKHLNRSNEINQIGPITALLQRLCQIDQLFAVDKALSERDLLKARNLHALPRFKCLDETCGVDQRLKGPCIEPRKSSSHPLHVKC